MAGFFLKSTKSCSNFPGEREIPPKLLNIIIDRLYVLRNQLIHGGATYKGGVNREQVSDAKDLLIDLIPTIIETMFNKADWR